MAEQLYLGLDLDQPVGSRLSAEAVAEIIAVAPSAVVNDSITTAKIRNDAVVNAKIADDAVTSEKILTGEVKTSNLADGHVTTVKIADDAVTKDKAGIGVVTGSLLDASPATYDIVVCTAAQYAGLAPVASTLYFVLA